ncbi:hypothetical protein ABG067_009431, partial [Albugo candida]
VAERLGHLLVEVDLLPAQPLKPVQVRQDRTVAGGLDLVDAVGQALERAGCGCRRTAVAGDRAAERRDDLGG